MCSYHVPITQDVSERSPKFLSRPSDCDIDYRCDHGLKTVLLYLLEISDKKISFHRILFKYKSPNKKFKRMLYCVY